MARVGPVGHAAPDEAVMFMAARRKSKRRHRKVAHPTATQTAPTLEPALIFEQVVAELQLGYLSHETQQRRWPRHAARRRG